MPRTRLAPVRLQGPQNSASFGFGGTRRQHDHRLSSDDRGGRRHVDAGLQQQRAGNGTVLSPELRPRPDRRLRHLPGDRRGRLRARFQQSSLRLGLQQLHALDRGLLQPGDGHRVGRGSIHGGHRRPGGELPGDRDPHLRQRGLGGEHLPLDHADRGGAHRRRRLQRLHRR